MRAELARPETVRAQVFAAYRRLLELRSQQSAFHPDAAQEILKLGPMVFAVRRENAATGQLITALHNVTGRDVELHLPGPYVDLLTGERIAGAGVRLAPYQVRWLTEPS